MDIFFVDGKDSLRNTNPALIDQKYISSTTFDQELRVAGRYSTGSLSDFAGGSMNNAFGQAQWDVPLDAFSGYCYFAGDVRLAHGSGGSFAVDGDLFVISAYDSIGAAWLKQIHLAVTSTGYLQLWKGTGGQLTGTLIATTVAPVLSQSSWVRLEICFGATTGFRCRVNGTTVIDAIGLGLQTGTVGQMRRAGEYWSQFGFNAVIWDNIVTWYADDADTWNGDLQVATYWPFNGVGADANPGGFVPSTGSALYPLLYERDDFPSIGNEFPNGNTNYVSSSTDDECYFRMQNPAVFSPILAVAVTVQARCLSGVTHQAVAFDGTTAYYSASQVLNTSEYRIHQFLFPVRPSDSAAWSVIDLQAGAWKFGVKISSPLSEYRLSSIALEVVHQRGVGALNRYRAY